MRSPIIARASASRPTCGSTRPSRLTCARRPLNTASSTSPHVLLNTALPQSPGLRSLSATATQRIPPHRRISTSASARIGVLSAANGPRPREARRRRPRFTRAFMYAGSPTVGVSLWSWPTARRPSDVGLTSAAAKQGATRRRRWRRAEQMNRGPKIAAFYWAPSSSSGLEQQT